MNKRLVLAIALSFLVMLIWSRIAPQRYPVDMQRVTEEPPPSPAFIVEQEELEPESLLSVHSQNRELIFSLPSASLIKVIFSDYDEYELNLGQGLQLAEKGLFFTEKKLTPQEAIFEHKDTQKRITKRYNYADAGYIMQLDIEIENISHQPLQPPDFLILGELDINLRGFEARFQELFIRQSNKIQRLSPNKVNQSQYSGDFIGFRNRYFCAIITPVNFPGNYRIIRTEHKTSQLQSILPPIALQSGQIGHLIHRVYLGPQQIDSLQAFHDNADTVIYYGFFDPISQILMSVLRFLSKLINNWGWAIVILSILIFITLYPLSIKQMRSMKDMQALQPKMAELRTLYKDNPQRLNKEVLELYKRHKVNPLGGCLPMLLQIPIFFALYQALIRSVELKGAHFLWIKDLSHPDRLVTSPEINLLPILMAGVMFFQQKFTTTPGASSSEQQKMMSFLLPIIFGIIFYRMPSGLVLYWFVNSLLMAVNQQRITVTAPMRGTQ